MSSAQQIILGSNTFSRANVFGMFLTLSFCLLVQPFGSLLYAKPRSALGRVIFFFWRLNPLACVMEVLLLAIALINGVWAVLKERRAPSGSPIGFRKHLQVTARVIQLLRGHGQLPEHWRVLVQEPQQSGIVQPSAIADESNPASAGSPHHSDHSVTASPIPNDSEPYSNASSPVSSLDISERQATAPNLSRSVRSPSQVEAGSPQSPRSEVATYVGSSRFAGRALGRSVLCHAELVLDIVSTTAVLLVLVKLASVVIPIHIRIPAWFMVTGWAAIQILFMTSRERDVDLDNSAYLIRRALELEGVLSHPITWTLSSLLLVPLFGYFTFVILFRTQPLPLAMIIAFDIFMALIAIMLHSWLWAISSSCIGNRRERCTERLRCASDFCTQSKPKTMVQILLVCIGFSFYCAFIYFNGLFTMICYSNPNVSWQYVILPFTVFTFAIWMWFFLPGVRFMSRGKDSEWFQGIMLFSNLVMTAFFFTGAMIMYDASKTYKPQWLDWLGRLDRLRRTIWGA